MSVWWTVPSARPNGGTAQVWKDAGYKVALWRTDGAEIPAADLVLRGAYPGYYAACNAIIRYVLAEDKKCNFVVCGGDDTTPDPNLSPYRIAEQCEEHFTCAPDLPGTCSTCRTFGCMQPTGDDWSDSQGRMIERIAGSPWIGRSFAERAYGGRGPWHEEYYHMGGDEELWYVAQKLGVYWMRPDLTHYHNHWGRPKPGETHGNTDNMPAFLRKANTSEEWTRYKSLLAARQRAGFPGHEVKP